MNNFGQNLQRTSILNELSDGNVELGEAFAMTINDMVVQSGITNSKADSFDIVTKSWRALASQENKTQEDLDKLNTTMTTEIKHLAASYLLFIARETGNLTGKLDYHQYETYQLKYRFGHFDTMNKPEYLTKVKNQIKNGFRRLSAHGELSGGDNLIDKKDMAAFIYAIATKTTRDENDQFKGFEINGIIKPEDYALCERLLFRDQEENNMMSLKLRLAYKWLYD